MPVRPGLCRSRLFLIELEWVLREAYKLPRQAVIAAFEGLLAVRHLQLEQEHLVMQALDVHRQGMDFADALHLVRSARSAAAGARRSHIQ